MLLELAEAPRGLFKHSLYLSVFMLSIKAENFLIHAPLGVIMSPL